MQQTENSNNDFRVVSFHNSTTFDFTPELGCMYDGRAINCNSGKPGIQAGETMIVPYHVGKVLAQNLAKRVLNTSPAAIVDASGVPTGVAVWNEDILAKKAEGFITDLYTEEKPLVQSETDKLMAKVEEYKSMVDKLLGDKQSAKVLEDDAPLTPVKAVDTDSKTQFLDKQEVIAELERRQIKYDRRSTKENLEKLLA
jgi:hypothetical protein